MSRSSLLLGHGPSCKVGELTRPPDAISKLRRRLMDSRCVPECYLDALASDRCHIPETTQSSPSALSRLVSNSGQDEETLDVDLSGADQEPSTSRRPQSPTVSIRRMGAHRRAIDETQTRSLHSVSWQDTDDGMTKMLGDQGLGRESAADQGMLAR